MNYYLKNTEQVLRELNSSEQGLSSQEAAQRLQKNGKNLLKEEEKRSTWRKFLDSITDPMILMLLGMLSSLRKPQADENGEGNGER